MEENSGKANVLKKTEKLLRREEDLFFHLIFISPYFTLYLHNRNNFKSILF